jgi:exonuclease III
MEKSSRQKLNTEKTLELMDVIKQMDLTDIYRIFHTHTHTHTQSTFFSRHHGTLSKIDYILDDKASLSRYKEIEITPYIQLDHHKDTCSTMFIAALFIMAQK